MQKTFVGVIAAAAVVAALIFTQALDENRSPSDPDPVERGAAPPPVEEGHPLLGAKTSVSLAKLDAASVPADHERQFDAVRALVAAKTAVPSTLTVTYPFDGSVFPPDLVPPTLLWTDADENVDTWHVAVVVGKDRIRRDFLVPGVAPPLGEIDPETVADTNEPPPQPGAFDRSWTPVQQDWDWVKEVTTDDWATVTITGFAHDQPGVPLSRGSFSLRTSKDPVGAPIFYRDVPLVPARTEEGVIKPLPKGATPLIAWRLKDVSRHDSRVVLKGMPTCANCHSFSQDGSTLGMDVDGPGGDKGTYMITPVEERMVVDYPDVITWNDFPEKVEGLNTLGFLSRISPTGRFVVTTINESLYVSNFTNYRFIQVFYPTRGIFAWYDKTTGEMRALPGADDPDYVHCDPAWFPDEKSIVFSRARARDPYEPGVPLAKEPNDPNEPVVRYDLYGMSFDEGRGGTPIPIEGASNNGMSNTFPKVSPDGRWIVYVKCKNGQLMRPDGKLWIVPAEGGEAREMRCNTWRMNSWHSFSPNGRWMVFSSKAFTPYTQMFLTHIDEEGNDTPPILIPNATAANRAVNIPEFLNASYDDMKSMEVKAVEHTRFINRGRDLLAEGRIDEAERMFAKSVELDAEFSRARVEWGHALQLLGRREEAREQFEKALELDAEDPAAWNNLGYLVYEQGEDHRPEAIRHYRRALELMPEYARARKNLAFALLADDDLEGALREYRLAVKADATDASIHGSISSILLRLGRSAEAKGHLEKAVALDADDAEAASALAWLLATSPDDTIRDGAEAVRLAERALQAGATPDRLDVLAAAYAEAGRFPDAVRTVERGLAENENGALERAMEARLESYRRSRPHRTTRVSD